MMMRRLRRLLLRFHDCVLRADTLRFRVLQMQIMTIGPLILLVVGGGSVRGDLGAWKLATN